MTVLNLLGFERSIICSTRLIYESQTVIHPLDSKKCICKMHDSEKRWRTGENKRQRKTERELQQSNRRLVDFSFFSFFCYSSSALIIKRQKKPPGKEKQKKVMCMFRLLKIKVYRSKPSTLNEKVVSKYIFLLSFNFNLLMVVFLLLSNLFLDYLERNNISFFITPIRCVHVCWNV